MYTGVYAAFEEAQTYTAADELFELQAGANTVVEILRVWVSADIGASPPDEVYRIDIYGNDAASTGGAALTEQPYQGAAVTSGVTAIGGSTAITIGGGPTVLYPDAFHGANGWLYLPVPEERIRFGAGGTIDNVGLRFSAVPTSITCSYGVVWGETKLA